MQLEHLGKLLETLRGNMTLREAARKTGLSHTYIRDLELEKKRTSNYSCKIKPSPETLRKFSEAYDFPYTELLRRAGYLNEPLDDHSVIKIYLHQFHHVDVSSQEITYHAHNIKVIKTIQPDFKITEFLEVLERHGFKKFDNNRFVNLHRIRKYSEQDGRVYFDEEGCGQYLM